MDAVFSEVEVLSAPGCSMTLEQENRPVTSGYDEERDPPQLRLVLRVGDGVLICNEFDELAQAISALNFPMTLFFERFPEQLAWIITWFVSLRRPITTHKLWEPVEADFGVRLADIAPAMVDGELRWFEYPRFGKPRELRERRWSLDPFNIR